MSRYQGFVPLLLILLCLWINIWRYPSVWIMLNGQYITQLTEEPLSIVRVNNVQENRILPKNVSGSEYHEPHDTSVPAISDDTKILSETKDNKTKDNNTNVNNTNVNNTNTVYSNSSQSLEKDEDLHESNRRENVFQHPVMSQPTDKSEKTDQNESEPESDDADRFVYMLPQNTSAKEKTLSAEKISIGPASIYQAPGSPGTKPMNLDNPTY